jgi:hypothetical protein
MEPHRSLRLPRPCRLLYVYEVEEAEQNCRFTKLS